MQRVREGERGPSRWGAAGPGQSAQEAGSRHCRERKVDFLSTNLKNIKKNFFLSFYLFGCAKSYLQYVGFSCLTRDQAQVPCIGSTES